MKNTINVSTSTLKTENKDFGVGNDIFSILNTSLLGACDDCGSAPCEDWCGKKNYGK